jgi:hypothetical protein
MIGTWFGTQAQMCTGERSAQFRYAFFSSIVGIAKTLS